MANKKLDLKDSVRVATVNSISNLSEVSLMIDGILLVVNDRILVKNGASIDGTEPANNRRNGIYEIIKIVSDKAKLVRSLDANRTKRVSAGMFTFVEEGIINKDAGYILITDNPITLGLDELIFDKFTGTGEISAEIQKSIDTNADNIVVNAFRLATEDSLTLSKMIDGVVDEYEDEDNVDAGASINKSYDAAGSFYKTEDNNLKLLLNLNGADNQTSTIDSSTQGHNVTMVGNAKLDTSTKQFGSASGAFDGNGDFLSIPDDPDWDLFEDTTSDYTVDLWVNKNVTTGNQHFVHQFQSGNDRWFIRSETTTGKLAVTGTIGGLNVLQLLGSTVLTAGIWYHVALIKVGNEYGIYVNGIQEDYEINNSTGIFSSILRIGASGFAGGSSFLNGFLDSVRIQKSNLFSAAPNVSNTDTIIVPTSELVTGIGNTTIVSTAQTAQAQPDDARVVLFDKQIDAIILNTDLKVSVSRDDGVTYNEVTLEEKGEYEDGKCVLVGSVDISSQPAGTDMRYKIETDNLKNIELHGIGLSWA